MSSKPSAYSSAPRAPAVSGLSEYSLGQGLGDRIGQPFILGVMVMKINELALSLDELGKRQYIQLTDQLERNLSAEFDKEYEETANELDEAERDAMVQGLAKVSSHEEKKFKTNTEFEFAGERFTELIRLMKRKDLLIRETITGVVGSEEGV